MQHDDEITSDELDALLDESETLDAARPSNATEMRLYVTLDSETLQELQHEQQRKAPTSTSQQPTPYAPAHAPPDALTKSSPLNRYP